MKSWDVIPRQDLAGPGVGKDAVVAFPAGSVPHFSRLGPHMLFSEIAHPEKNFRTTNVRVIKYLVMAVAKINVDWPECIAPMITLPSEANSGDTILISQVSGRVFSFSNRGQAPFPDWRETCHPRADVRFFPTV